MTHTVQKELLSFLQALYPEHFSALTWSDIVVTFNEGDTAKLGDCATNCALVLSKKIGKNPRALGEEIIQKITDSRLTQEGVIASGQIAGPGFINLTLKDTFWSSLVENLAEDIDRAIEDNSAPTPKTSYVVEFVSANPTGPLHLGHGRNGIVGDTLARVLTYRGHSVIKEFYVNDAGAQMEKLGNSVKIRAQQQVGIDVALPEDGYHGTYISDLAREYLAANQNRGEIAANDSIDQFKDFSYKAIMKEQEKDLADYQIVFDSWFSEQSLHTSGAVRGALDALEAKDLLYRSEGARWFRATLFGDDKDRVIEKSDGSLTYIAADIAYHINKFSRARKLITVLGQDHHGYVLRLQGTMAGLGYDIPNMITVLTQLVSIKQGSIPVKMSKRAGTFTTLRELIDAIGVDAARFFFLNKKIDAHLEIDVSTALERTTNNPLFYLQYAYVRTRSVARKSPLENISGAAYSGTYTAEEKTVLKKLAQLSLTLDTIIASSSPHLLASYALDVAQIFHSFYANNKIIISDDAATSLRRQALTKATENVLATTLKLLGLSAPEEM